MNYPKDVKVLKERLSELDNTEEKRNKIVEKTIARQDTLKEALKGSRLHELLKEQARIRGKGK